MAKAVFHIPDDPDTIPVNENTKGEKLVVELIRDYLKKREKEKDDVQPQSDPA